MRAILIYASVLAGAGFGAAACTDDFPCDPGQVLKENQCIDDPSEPADGDASGAGGQAQAAADADTDADEDTDTDADAETDANGEFGRVCTVDEDCADPAPSCGLAPGASEGVCTALGCQSEGTACPDGWMCLSFADACIQG